MAGRGGLLYLIQSVSILQLFGVILVNLAVPVLCVCVCVRMARRGGMGTHLAVGKYLDTVTHLACKKNNKIKSKTC